MATINFVTKRMDHDPFIYKSQKIAVTSDLEPLDKYLESVLITGFDTEYNGERLFKANLLLASVGETGNLWVIDCTCPSTLKEFIRIMNKHAHRVRFVGHNIQSDLTICSWHGLWFELVWDTMIGSQRLNLGLANTGKFSNSLAAEYQRQLGVYMEDEKEIRLEFITMTPTSRFLVKHIMYSGGDTARIVEIANKQREQLIARGQFDFVKNVECDLVAILTAMKLQGVYLDEDKWNVMIFNKQKKKLEVEVVMDQEVARLTGIRQKQRRRGEYVSLDLFGQHKEVENQNKKHLNYSSPQQIFKVFNHLALPLPQLVSKGKVSNSTKEEALQQYIIERPHTPLRFLLEQLIEFRGYQKLITSYGKKFLRDEIRKKGGKKELGYRNPVSRLVHTMYKQCSTDTGRLASGDARQGLYNSQNVPRDKELRECFGLTPEEIADDWWVTTCDWSGAELLIMAALADDQHLYELGADKIVDGVKVEGDLHSPLATKSWRAVYAYRLANGRDMTIQDTTGKKYTLCDGFLIDKDHNKPLRTDFKRMGFGVVYGLKANKGAQTLNIPKDEAAIVIEVIEKEIPKTIQMVKDAAMCALADGYLVFNKKSNNRRFFPAVMSVLAQIPANKTRAERYQIVREQLDFKTISEIEGEARNCRIQGTQADMLKEAMVKLYKYIKDNKIEAKFIFTVHDELVIKHKGFGFGAKIAEIMKEVANSYLALYSDNIRMGAEYKTIHSWTK